MQYLIISLKVISRFSVHPLIAISVNVRLTFMKRLASVLKNTWDAQYEARQTYGGETALSLTIYNNVLVSLCFECTPTHGDMSIDVECASSKIAFKNYVAL